VNLSMTTQTHGWQQESNTRLIYIALAVSLIMHFAVMRVLPWLEVEKAKPPITIIAELQQAPPPPAEAPAELKPIEPPSKPEVVKQPQITADKPTTKPQVVAQPVLTSEHSEPVTNDYQVPEAQQAAVTPSVATVATPMESASAPSVTSSAKNTAASTSSTSTWDESDAWDEYGRNLQRLCERYKQYPAIAIRRGWQGAVKVLVRFSAEGKATGISIEKSTGQKSLDDQALEMVRKSLNDLPVPNKFKGREFRLSIPVDFKLE